MKVKQIIEMIYKVNFNIEADLGYHKKNKYEYEGGFNNFEDKSIIIIKDGVKISYDSFKMIPEDILELDGIIEEIYIYAHADTLFEELHTYGYIREDFGKLIIKVL